MNPVSARAFAPLFPGSLAALLAAWFLPLNAMAAETGPDSWDECYTGSALPESGDWPWHVSAGARTTAAVEDGTLHLRDEGTAKGELRFYSRQWFASPGCGGIVEARLRVGSCSGRSGVVLLAADGRHEVAVTFFPDRVEIGSNGRSQPASLSGAFHTCRLELAGTRVRLSVDGKDLLDEPSSLVQPAHEGRNLVGFGSCSSSATGEAWWEWVRHRSGAPLTPLVPDAEHVIVYKKAGVYACFPSLHHLPDGSLHTSFGTRSRRSHIDGSGGSATCVSRDGGRTWQAAERGGVTQQLYRRRDGGLAWASAIGWREVPQEREAEFRARGLTVRAVRPGVVAYLSDAQSFLQRAGEDKGRKEVLPAPPGISLMNYNSAALCVTRSGVRLHAIYGLHQDRDVSSCFALRSADDGESWDLVTIAAPVPDAEAGALGFGETALAEMPDGRILALMRPDPDRHGFLWQSASRDEGQTWSIPEKTPLWGYPAHLLVLRDGRVLCTYGYRRAPMGIRACLSRDGGHTWDHGQEWVLRADGKRSGSDLGYPLTTELEDGRLVTVYYFTCGDGITHVAATRWRAP